MDQGITGGSFEIRPTPVDEEQSMRRKRMMTMLKSGGIAFCAIFCAQSVLAQDAPGVLVSAEWLE